MREGAAIGAQLDAGTANQTVAMNQTTNNDATEMNQVTKSKCTRQLK